MITKEQKAKTLEENLTKYFASDSSKEVIKTFFTGTYPSSTGPYIRIRVARRIGLIARRDMTIREVIRPYSKEWTAEDWQSFEQLCKENL